MNVERPHAIALEPRQELEEGQTPLRHSALVVALEETVSQPQQPQFQQQVSDALTSLREALASASSNDLVPTWRQTFEELWGCGPAG